MQYTVVEKRNIENLITEVNRLIGEGWIPQGGICESGSDNNFLFFQAMIKKS